MESAIILFQPHRMSRGFSAYMHAIWDERVFPRDMVNTVRAVVMVENKRFVSICFLFQHRRIPSDVRFRRERCPRLLKYSLDDDICTARLNRGKFATGFHMIGVRDLRSSSLSGAAAVGCDNIRQQKNTIQSPQTTITEPSNPFWL